MKNQNNEKLKFSLAPAAKRIFARFFDMLLLSIISIGVFCALTLWIIINHKNNYNEKMFSGMLLLSFFISFCIFFIYFIIIPYLWKGYTIFKKIFKIKTHELINDKNFFIDLIKKELFIWFFFFIINFIFSIILFFYPKPLDILNKLLTFNFNFSDEYIFIPIFQFMYVIFFIPILIITIHLSLNSKKRTLHDYFSNTCVIYTIPISDETTDTNDKLPIYNYELPGLINDDVLKEINND